MNFTFPGKKQYFKLHKIRTDKDIAIFNLIFFFEKPKNLGTIHKPVLKGDFKEHEQKNTFHLLVQCTGVFYLFCFVNCSKDTLIYMFRISS